MMQEKMERDGCREESGLEFCLIPDQIGEARLVNSEKGETQAVLLLNEDNSAWIANLKLDSALTEIISHRSKKRWSLRPREAFLVEDGDMISFSDKCFKINIEGSQVLISNFKMK